MPFIRYKIGVKGKVIHEHNCSCGNKEPVIKLAKARENDWIYHSDGTVSHSDLFCHIIERINLELEQVILQYQVVQTDYSEFEIYFVMNEEEYASRVQSMFVDCFEKYQQGNVLRFHIQVKKQES